MSESPGEGEVYVCVNRFGASTRSDRIRSAQSMVEGQVNNNSAEYAFCIVNSIRQSFGLKRVCISRFRKLEG